MINNQEYKLWINRELKQVSYKPFKKCCSAFVFDDYQSRIKCKDDFVDNYNYEFVGRKTLFDFKSLLKTFTGKFVRPVI